jgi:hypothetical protein
MVCFNCGGVGHRQRDCKKKSTKEATKSGAFCFGCGIKGHDEANCWKVHPELKPKNMKEAKGGDSKEAKSTGGEKKSWKARFTELEAKMAAMSSTTTTGATSFYAEGSDHMLCGMADAQGAPIDAYALTRSKTVVQDPPRGASSGLDPQRGEANRQARLPESFALDDMVPTTTMIPPQRNSSSRQAARALRGDGQGTSVLFDAATAVCQAPLFTASMISQAQFSAPTIFKLAATMCEDDASTSVDFMEAVLEPQATIDNNWAEADELLAAATRVKTMPARSAIERSSITPGVVVLDNSQGIFQLVGPKGRVLAP